MELIACATGRTTGILTSAPPPPRSPPAPHRGARTPPPFSTKTEIQNDACPNGKVLCSALSSDRRTDQHVTAAGLQLCLLRRTCLGQCCRPTQNAEPNPFVFCRSVRNFQVRALARAPAPPCVRRPTDATPATRPAAGAAGPAASLDACMGSGSQKDIGSR